MVVVVALLGLAPLPWTPATVAGAAPGEAQPILDTKSVNVTQAEGGDLITYSISFSCSNVGDDDCSGAVFSDPLPTFIDVYGNEIPVEFVSASGPAEIWGDPQFTLVPGNPPVVTGTAEDWPAGTSGAIAITVRVPPGSVPEGSQTLENTATVTDPEAPGYTDDSTTVTTTITGQAPDWEISKLGPPDDGLRPDNEYTWTVRVCAADPASAVWPVYEITDTLPPGFHYISSDPAGTYADDGDPPDDVSDGAGTVTWTYDEDNPPPVGEDGCFLMHVTGEFPSDYPGNEEGEDNSEGQVKTNTATGTGATDPDGEGTSLGEGSTTNEMTGPQFGGAGVTKYFTDLAGADDFFVADGDTGRWNLSVTVDSDFLLDRVELDDGTWEFTDGGPPELGGGLPESFVATEVDPGTWNDPVTATIEGSNNGLLWTTLATGVESGDPVIVLDPTFRSIRWVWESPGAIRGDFSATGMSIAGVIGEDDEFDDFGQYTNIATTTIDRADAEPFETSAEDTYQLENPQPHPGITKTASAGHRQPGQAADLPGDGEQLARRHRRPGEPDRVGLRARVHRRAGHADRARPWVAGPPLSCGEGETAVSFRYAGSLAPGAATPPITITTVVAGPDPGPPAPYGEYRNTAFVSPGSGGSFGHCQNTDPVCGAEASVVVDPTVQLASEKCVSGELDNGVFRPTPRCTDGEEAVVPAQTLPGGTIEYRLDLSNVGNTDATDIVFIDILPHEGDTAVITTSNGALVPRNSEYTPILISPIAAPVVLVGRVLDLREPLPGRGRRRAGNRLRRPRMDIDPDPARARLVPLGPAQPRQHVVPR